VIVLDTNQAELLGVSPSPLFLMVKHVASTHEHELAIPEIVLVEMLAHWRHKVETQLKAVEVATAELERLHAPLAPHGLPNVDKLVERREEVLRDHFTVLPVPEGAAWDGLRREANRQRPADVDWGKKGEGARDVVVWLTLLASSEQYVGDLVFVSNDGDFFDKRGELHPELKAEAADHAAEGCSFQCARKIDDLLAMLATEVPVPANFNLLESSRPVVKGVVGKSAQDSALAGVRSVRESLGDRAQTSFEISELAVEPRSKTYAYEVNGRTWICARARWTGCVDVEISIYGADVVIPTVSIPFVMDGSILADGPEAPPHFAQLLSQTTTRLDEPIASVQRAFSALLPTSAELG
jgi:hypothetical protein